MDPNAVVLEISSDEDVGWNDLPEKGIIDGDDDYNWIADILDEVNRDDCGYDDGGDDSDEVVLVSEVLPKKPRKKLTFNPLHDLDDDCVVLDHDPDKPPEARTDNPTDPKQDDDDEDDIIVVSEKGQVACRDYPHPRHLCIKFPFSSTPNQTHCDQCYCYVCDSLAPCIYWGNGSGSIDHCLATDKIEFWVFERKNSKNVGKEVSVPSMNLVPVPQTNQTLMPNPIQSCPVTSSFRVGNIINQDRNPFVLSRNKYQPSFVSQQLTRTSSCTIPGGRVHHSYNLSAPIHRPVFKRTVSDVFGTTTNRYSYSSYYRNQFTGSSQPNIVNASVPITSRSDAPFDFLPNLQPLVNSDPYLESPVPLPSQPNYAIYSEASRQESQRSTVDPKFFNGISWPESQINHQPAVPSPLVQGVGSTNEPSLASGSGGLVDYEYDNWMFNCEARSMGGSGPFGLSELPGDAGYMDSGTIFEF